MTARPLRRGAGRMTALLGLLAVVLLVAGALLATVARPAQEAVRDVGAAAVDGSADGAGAAGAAPLLLLEPPVLAGLADDAGEVVVRASGPGAVLVAAGRDADVAAWADGAAAVVATGADDDGAVTTRSAAGEGAVPDPAGSDLWTAQDSGTGAAELVVQVAGGATAVLVAADGTAPAPSAVQVVGQHRPFPLLAWPLLGAGGLLAAVTALRLRRRRARERVAVVQLPETALVGPDPAHGAPSWHAPHDAPAQRRPRGRRAAR